MRLHQTMWSHYFFSDKPFFAFLRIILRHSYNINISKNNKIFAISKYFIYLCNK